MSADLKNPFPGMNPWLEAHWHSAHSRFLTYASDQISTQLPPGLAALTEERVVIENFREDFKKTLGPDIAIEQPWDETPPRKSWTSEGGVALAEPTIVQLDDPVERCVQIVDSSGALITAIEVLSPTNKDDARGRAAYRAKQKTYQEGGVNLVEIDLIRRGERIFRIPEHHYGSERDHPYGVCVWRASEPDKALAIAGGYRKRLPVVKIPLREQDEDAVLDIQAVLDETYEKGRYHYLIRYDSWPSPALPEDEQDWAEQLLGEKGFLPG